MVRLSVILQMAIAMFLFSIPCRAELPVGKKPTPVVLDGDSGGKVSGGMWTSLSLTGKVHVMFYVDPDESDMNDHVADALRAEKFSLDRYGSVAVINMAATWMPNAAINMKLRSKQEKFPETVYVRDLKKALVNAWHLADDSNDVVAFDKDGSVIFSRDGKLSADDIKALVSAVRSHLQ